MTSSNQEKINKEVETLIKNALDNIDNSTNLGDEFYVIESIFQDMQREILLTLESKINDV